MSDLKKVLGYATESANDFVSDILQGKELEASENIKSERRVICNSCEYKKKIAMIEYCSECKCSITAKTAVNSFHCPYNKWGRVNV